MGTIILTDSCCDLPLEYIEANSDVVDVIGMPVVIEDKEYIDDLGKTLLHDELYKKLREGIMPSTSQINSYRFTEKYKKHYDNGNSVIYVGFSSGLSGTLNNAAAAKDMFLEEHPDADITVIDTLSASIGLGLLVTYAVDMVRQGKSNEEIAKWIEDNKFKSNHWFGVDDLIYLKNGGRISPATAVVGTVLNVKPVIIVNHDGKLVSYGNVRGRKKSLKYLVNKLEEHKTDSTETRIIIGHGNCLEDAKKLEKFVRDRITPKDIIISQLSATIASHVGPNMIAIVFIGDTREHKDVK